MAVRVGRIKDRCKIQQLSEALDEFGQRQQTWVTLADRWAGIEPLSGRERLQGDQVYSDLTHRVVLRYLAELTPKMRVVCGTRILEIVSVIDRDNRHEQQELLCMERVG